MIYQERASNPPQRHGFLHPMLLALVCVVLGGLLVACDDDPKDAAAPSEDSVDLDEGSVDLDSSGDGSSGDAADVMDVPTLPDVEPEHFAESTHYAFAQGCYAIGHSTSDETATVWLRATADGEAFAFEASATAEAAAFFAKPSDLGTYLFYDTDRAYLVVDDGPLLRPRELPSDITLVDDTHVSGAEWQIEPSQRVAFRYQLRSRRAGQLLGLDGLTQNPATAAALVLEAVDGCTPYPEMSLDATGTVQHTTYPDGDLFGFADTHSHILSNVGFGGGGVFHGAPFHRLGVEHAMGSCERFHGVDGRADVLGWGAGGGGDGIDANAMMQFIASGLLPEFNHATDGWPTYSDWPSVHSATHQTQYYRWLERAWMSGLRLVVQHAVSNEAICDLMVDTRFQPARWGCEDMLNIDRQLEEIRRMERYIDAQMGGPGQGWLRVVESPAEAREVIAQGKLAVVLGIEVPNLFDCYLTPRPGGPVCDAAHIEAQLDEYHGKGVRVLFPNHKYDNAFTPGDGDKGIFELGNFLQTGHWSNYVEDCPDVSTVFDKGPVQFGGFNLPRDDYLAPAPNEPMQLSTTPLLDFLPYAEHISAPSLPGNWCQNAGLTAAGVTLIEGIMARGMVLEIDHLPRRSYLEVFDMLVAADYPAVGTHGNTHGGKLYTDIGGLSKTGFGRCADPANPGSMAASFRDRRDQRVAAGLYPAEGFGFDLNGLAGVPKPRFGDGAGCGVAQENPVTYPFTSYDGDVTFTEPRMGERVVDFNTEGLIHVGMVPELIEDARRTAVTDEDLDILFRSAEGYIRMWERAEARAAAMN